MKTQTQVMSSAFFLNPAPSNAAGAGGSEPESRLLHPFQLFLLNLLSALGPARLSFKDLVLVLL